MDEHELPSGRGIDVPQTNTVLYVQTVRALPSSPEPHQSQSDTRGFDLLMRGWVALLAVLGTLAMFGALTYFTYVSSDPSKLWMRKIVIDHPGAAIGLPICAVIASCIILLFNATSGPMDLETPVFKLKGGSGPAVLWVVVLLALAYAMRLLWGA